MPTSKLCNSVSIIKRAVPTQGQQGLMGKHESTGPNSIPVFSVDQHIL